MISANRSKSVMRSAIFAIWISASLLASRTAAQERPWEVSLFLPSFNTYYQENANDPSTGQPMDMEGNSWNALQFHPSITYRVRQELGLPFFFNVQADIPIATVTRLEVGHQQLPSGVNAVSSKEQVSHNDMAFRAQLGWEMMPFLQPYIGLERSRFASERTGQVSGNDTGGFTPDNPDYTETVYSTQLGLGFTGAIPINENGDIRLRYELGYEIPQAIFVSNSYLSESGTWGRGTGGYTIGGKLQFDIPVRSVQLLQDHDGYLTIGVLASKRHWNGWSGSGTIHGLPAHIIWPENYWVKAGGFVGIGMFF